MRSRLFSADYRYDYLYEKYAARELAVLLGEYRARHGGQEPDDAEYERLEEEAREIAKEAATRDTVGEEAYYACPPRM
jgi:hypothetical protein